MLLNDHRIKCPDEPLYWQGGSTDVDPEVWLEIEIFKLTHHLINIQITLQSSNDQTNQLWTFEAA